MNNAFKQLKEMINEGLVIEANQVAVSYFGQEPIYELSQLGLYVIDLNDNIQNPDLYWLSPKNDLEGEPDHKISFNVTLKKEEKHVPTREEHKLSIASLIASLSNNPLKNSIEWLDIACGIHNLELTTELFKELEEKPYDMQWSRERGWYNADLVIGRNFSSLVEAVKTMKDEVKEG